MAKITRQLSWRNAFNTQRFLNSCYVRIFSNNNSLLYGETNISSFHYSGKAKRVMDFFPSEEITFTILRYSTLTSIKKGDFIHIRYEMSGYATNSSAFLPFIVKDLKYNKKRDEMVVYGCSLFEVMTSGASIHKEQITNTTGSATFSDVGENTSNIFNTIIQKYFSSQQIITYGYSLTNAVKRIPASLTDGELLQHICMISATYPRVYSYYTSPKMTFAFSMQSLDDICHENPDESIYYYNLGFNSNKDIEETYEDKQEVALVGCIIGNQEKSDSFVKTINSNMYSTDFVYEIDKNVKPTRISVSTGSLITSVSYDYDLYNNMVEITLTRTGQYLPQDDYTITFYYNEITTPMQQDSNYLYLITPLVNDMTSQEQTWLIDDYNKYYNNSCFIEFTGRLDPYIQPCDVIEDENGQYIFIEEVDVDYSGSFKVRLRGRKSAIYQPVLEEIESAMPDWYFKVYNPNDSALTIKIDYEGTTLVSQTLNSKAHLRFDSDNNIVLDPYFYDYSQHDLSSPLVMYLVDNDGNKSQETFILKGNT